MSQPAPADGAPWERWIARSFADHFGRPLAPDGDPYGAGTAVLCHRLTDDPTFVYANRTAQQLWERPWRCLIGMPSRLTAPPEHRAERSAALDGHQVATAYSGERISATGRRFRIIDATIFPVADDTGAVVGQAATFDRWEPVRDRPILEVLATSPDEITTAVAGGADRLELCADYAGGGLTPSASLVRDFADTTREGGVGIMAMIRPRPGDFVYSRGELAAMSRSVSELLDAGASGVVLGCMTDAGRLDEQAIATLIDVAGGAPVTVHRAVDACADPIAAARIAFALGASRVLTSGGADTAMVGAETIGRMVAVAPSQVDIVAASGITAANVAGLVAATGVREVHGSLRTAAGPPDAASVRAVRDALTAGRGG